MWSPSPQVAAASIQTRRAVAASLLGTLFVILVAATPNSPFFPVHPVGAGPSGPLRWIADGIGLSLLPDGGLVLVGFIAAMSAGIGFLLIAREAWNGRVSMRLVITLTVGFHLLVLLLPLLFSRDVYSYSYYGRIVSTYGANPYVTTPADFSLNGLWPLTWPGWRTTPSVYGPLFIWMSAAITSTVHSINALIHTFQLFAVIVSLTTIYVMTRLARREWPDRAVFAAAVIGLNPVVIFQVVAAGHNDMLVALAIAIAASCLFSHRELWGTVALTLGMLVKATAAIPLLLLVIVAVARAEPGERRKVLAQHAGIIGAISLFFAFPFMQSQNPTLGLLEVAGHDSWLAPGQLIVRAFAGAGELIGGSGMESVGDTIGRLGLFALLGLTLFLIARQLWRDPRNHTPTAQMAAWGWALLAVILLSPVLLPWYITWLLPLVWVLPRVPRRATILTSAALIFAQLATEPNRVPEYIDLQIPIGHPVLMFVVVWMALAMYRRLRARVPFDHEISDEPQIGDRFEAGPRPGAGDDVIVLERAEIPAMAGGPEPGGGVGPDGPPYQA